jgi:molybdate transport system substrate-binding protein
MRRIGALASAVLLAACSASPPVGSSSTSLTVFAAASLRDAFEEIATTYEARTGVAIALSFDASSALRTQIVQGAPADLFASADRTNPQQLADQGLTDGEPTIFAANGLAIVAPADGSGIESWQELGEPGTRVVAAGEDVPITAYASELVDGLSTLPDAPAGFPDAYEENVVSREDNVRAVLAKVEVGEGDGAIVYETDAASSNDVTTIDYPPATKVIAEYAFVVLRGSGPATEAFADWLIGPDGQAVLERFGFRPAES